MWSSLGLVFEDWSTCGQFPVLSSHHFLMLPHSHEAGRQGSRIYTLLSHTNTAIFTRDILQFYYCHCVRVCCECKKVVDIGCCCCCCCCSRCRCCCGSPLCSHPYTSMSDWCFLIAGRHLPLSDLWLVLCHLLPHDHCFHWVHGPGLALWWVTCLHTMHKWWKQRHPPSIRLKFLCFCPSSLPSNIYMCLIQCNCWSQA